MARTRRHGQDDGETSSPEKTGPERPERPKQKYKVTFDWQPKTLNGSLF